MKVIGYVRVSTLDQAGSGLGLTAQRAAIETEASRRDWHLAAIHEDAGVSGKTGAHRPGLDDALVRLAAGDATALVVAKLDRLSRSVVDFASLMERSRGEGWALVALDLGVDTTTPSGEMVANVMATFAQFERRLIGQRTRDALEIKRAQGVRLGRPRVVQAPTIGRIRDLRSVGLSWRAVAAALNEEQVPTGHGAMTWTGASARYVALSRQAGDQRDSVVEAPVATAHESKVVRTDLPVGEVFAT